MASIVRIYEDDGTLIYTIHQQRDGNIDGEQYVISDDDDTEPVIVDGLYSIEDLSILSIGPLLHQSVQFNCFEIYRMKHLKTVLLSSVDIPGGFSADCIRNLELSTLSLVRVRVKGSLNSFEGCSMVNLRIERCTFDVSTVDSLLDMRVSNLTLCYNGLSMSTLPTVGAKSMTIEGENIRSIGDDVRSMIRLKHLCVQQCGLSGCIPSSICKLTRLEKLILSSNELGGTIPASIAAMSRLTILHLDHNRLEGTVPTLPPYIEYISLQCNRLSGSVDNLYVPTTILVHIYGNPELYGEITDERFILTTFVDVSMRVRPVNRDNWLIGKGTDRYGTEFVSYTFLGM